MIEHKLMYDIAIVFGLFVYSLIVCDASTYEIVFGFVLFDD